MADKTLYFGDNLKILRDNIRDETIDLIYLDPPFNSKMMNALRHFLGENDMIACLTMMAKRPLEFSGYNVTGESLI